MYVDGLMKNVRESLGVRLALLWLLAGASACATSAAPKAVRAASGEDVMCRTERPTGSNLDVQVCTTKAQRDEIKANTRSVQQEMRNTQAGSCMPPGCVQ